MQVKRVPPDWPGLSTEDWITVPVPGSRIERHPDQAYEELSRMMVRNGLPRTPATLAAVRVANNVKGTSPRAYALFGTKDVLFLPSAQSWSSSSGVWMNALSQHKALLQEADLEDRWSMGRYTARSLVELGIELLAASRAGDNATVERVTSSIAKILGILWSRWGHPDDPSGMAGEALNLLLGCEILEAWPETLETLPDAEPGHESSLEESGDAVRLRLTLRTNTETDVPVLLTASATLRLNEAELQERMSGLTKDIRRSDQRQRQIELQLRRFAP